MEKRRENGKAKGPSICRCFNKRVSHLTAEDALAALRLCISRFTEYLADRLCISRFTEYLADRLCTSRLTEYLADTERRLKQKQN